MAREQTVMLDIPLRTPLPLVDDVSRVEHFVMTDHAIERCEERGIGVMEVYSALAEPQFTKPGRKDSDSTSYVRGDIRVTVHRNSITTVVDMEEDHRTVPRVPLNPLTPRKVAPVAAKKLTGDELWAVTPHKSDDYRKIIVTPLLAERLLILNERNRRVSRKDVEEWRRKLRTGEFQRTHQGIAIDTEGVLQDGQHRLTAIAEEGIAATMWVAVGCPPTNFEVIDIGRGRTNMDALYLAGIENERVLAPIIRTVYLYRTVDSPVNWSKVKVTPHIALEEYNKDPKEYDLAAEQAPIIREGCGMTRNAAGSGFYLMRAVNPARRVGEFMDNLITGADLRSGDPRLALRRILEQGGLADRRGRIAVVAHMTCLFKAWNAWAAGISMERMTYKNTDQMPPITKIGR